MEKSGSFMTMELPTECWTADVHWKENTLLSFQSHCCLGFLSLAAKSNPNKDMAFKRPILGDKVKAQREYEFLTRTYLKNAILSK